MAGASVFLALLLAFPGSWLWSQVQDRPPVFDAPVGGFVFTLFEDTADGFAVGDPLQAYDPDGEVLVYSLSNPDVPFTIDVLTGQLRVLFDLGEAFDFEVRSSYQFRVIAIESRDDAPGAEELSGSALVSVFLDDLDDTSPTIPEGQVFVVNSGSEDDARVGQVQFTDPDSIAFTYTLHTLEPVFEITPEDGVIRLHLEAEERLAPLPSSYELLISVTDAAGNESRRVIVTVNVRTGSDSAEKRQELEAFNLAHAGNTADMLVQAFRRGLQQHRRGDPEEGDYFSHDPEFSEGEDPFPPELRLGREEPSLAEIGEFSIPPPGGFGTRGSGYTWARLDTRDLDALPDFAHAVLDFGGDTTMATVGIDRQLNEGLAVGFAVSNSISSFEYVLRPEASPVVTAGEYKETSYIVSTYALLSTNLLHAWTAVSLGGGKVEDDRTAVRLRARAKSDSGLVLLSAGLEMGRVFGDGWIRLEVDAQGSIHGLHTRVEGTIYEGVLGNEPVDSSRETILETRLGGEVGVPFSLGYFGLGRVYASAEYVYEIGGNLLNDRDAVNFRLGSAWKWGRLRFSLDHFLERRRTDHDVTGFGGSFHFLTRSGERGLSFRLTGSQGAALGQSEKFGLYEPVGGEQEPGPLGLEFDLRYGIPVHLWRFETLIPFLQFESSGRGARYLTGSELTLRARRPQGMKWRVGILAYRFQTEDLELEDSGIQARISGAF